MRGLFISASLLATMGLLSTGLWGADAAKADEQLRDSARVLHEIMSTPDRGIPQDLLAKARCVALWCALAYNVMYFAKYLVGSKG